MTKKWSLEGLETKDAKIDKVYDGDTFNLVLPVCCEQYIFPCRLNGVDTPEIRTKNNEEKQLGIEVREYVKKLLNDTPFVVKCGKFDKYGRILCDVIITIDGREESMAEHLISKQYAYQYAGGTKRPFNEWH